ncbi:hypothetical protein PENTCL1PPCAC_15467, partial [Pristionchus entomophagus]
SLGGNWTVDWSTRGTVRPYFGAFCIIFALVTIPLYVLSAQVIWNMRRSPTYKVMFVLAIADITTLSVNAFTFGIFLCMYYNVAHIFNNTIMPSVSFIAYIFMILYIMFKRGESASQEGQNAVNRAAMMLSIQSGIIVVVHFTSCITYIVTQYVPPSHTVLYIAQITWQLLHGIPPFIYMAFNASLRDGVKQYAAPVRSSFMSLPSSKAPNHT